MARPGTCPGNGAIEACQPLLQASECQLSVDLPTEPLPVDADAVRIVQVVTNLLNNAVKYSPGGGKIRLRVAAERERAVLSVRDNGIGVAPEMLPRLFDIFMQVRQPARETQSGLGIGLSLVRRLTELHGGSVEARSAGLGKGAEFLVRLPLASDRSAAPAAAQSAKSTPPSPPKLRLLVVDDNQDAAKSLTLLLRLHGHEVQAAFDGPQALERLQTFRPAAMIVDPRMPGMDGFEVARRVREQSPQDAPTLVALTGWGQDDARRQSAAAGFTHHLVKPIEIEALQSMLAALPHP